jgi:hypothetical protein
MGKLHSNAKKSFAGRGIRRITGDKLFDQAHFLGTAAVKQRDATKAAERAATDAANEPIMPIADDDELQRSKRKMLSRRNRGRASTILANDAETLG